MTTKLPSWDFEMRYSTLGVLKHLGLTGALRGEIQISIPSLATEFDVSTQTMSKRLKSLDDAGLINWRPESDHPQLSITTQGRSVLQSEYEELRRLCEPEKKVILKGEVADGIGEGSYFVSLEGYREQFVEKIGYEPFPGTLNIELESESIRLNSRLERSDSILIESWINEHNETFGPVYCYFGTLRTGTAEYAPVHILEPEHSRYGDDILEVIAPDKLRNTLGLETGHRVTLTVDRN